MNAYSPTSTEIANFCMRKWGFYKAGYRSRYINYKHLAGFIGTGFAAGAAIVNRTVQAKGRADLALQQAIEHAKAAAQAELDAYLNAGGSISPRDEKTADALLQLVEVAVTLFIAKYPHEGQILEVEKAYPDHGNARLDMLYRRNADRKRVVVDYKVKMKARPEWWNKEVERYSRSHQLYEYVDMTQADAYEICFIILAPVPEIRVIPFEVNQDYLNLWRRDARYTWQLMESMKDWAIPFMYGNLTHEDKWGECEYRDACLAAKFDPQDLALNFIKVDKRVPNAIG